MKELLHAYCSNKGNIHQLQKKRGNIHAYINACEVDELKETGKRLLHSSLSLVVGQTV